MRIVFSPAARADLSRIDDQTFEKFGALQADKTKAAFKKVLNALATLPLSARKRPELDPPGRHFRYRPVLRRFILVCESLEDRIRIARILDGIQGNLHGILSAEPGDGEDQ